MNLFTLKIYATNGVFYDGEAQLLNIKTLDGMYAIQAKHRDTILALVPGVIGYIDNSGQKSELVVSNGIVNMNNNVALVITEKCYIKEDYLKSIEREKELILEEEKNFEDSQKEFASTQVRLGKMMEKLSKNKNDF